MTTYTTETLNIFPFQNQMLEATFYKPHLRKMKTVLLYFHGGGFVFGTRDDLPEEYVDHLTNLGIGLLAVDYPLAPETKLPLIMETTYKITEWFVGEFLAEQALKDYFIFGRSAGSFLALANGVYAKQLSVEPKGIVSLYGYFNLNEAAFTVPNRYYLQYPKVSKQTVTAQIQDKPVFQSASQNRYFIYMAARQTGNWMDNIFDSTADKKECSITKADIKTLPPLFLSAATKDPDVPSRQSRQLANLHSDSTLYMVDSDEHDFDRTQIDTLGMKLYEKLGKWILHSIK